MDVFIGGRGSGKTISLLEYSSITRTPIVVYSEEQCTQLKNFAKSLCIDIPEPVSFHSYPNKSKGNDNFRNGVLIENVDLLLKSIFGKVNAVTVDSSSIKIHNMDNTGGTNE